MHSQDAIDRAEKLLADAFREETAAMEQLLDITSRLQLLDREKCVVKEAAILRLMQQPNPTAPEKDGMRSCRSATNAESVWETDPTASQWLATYHRVTLEKLIVQTRCRLAEQRLQQAQTIFQAAMLAPGDTASALSTLVEVMGARLELIAERIEQVGEWYVSATDRLGSTVARLS